MSTTRKPATRRSTKATLKIVNAEDLAAGAAHLCATESDPGLWTYNAADGAHMIDADPTLIAVNAAVVTALQDPARREPVKALLAHALWYALPLQHEDARRARLLASYDERIDAVLEHDESDRPDVYRCAECGLPVEQPLVGHPMCVPVGEE